LYVKPRIPFTNATKFLWTNCLTEIFFNDAIDRAAELDSYIAKYGKPVGPLHGVPVSVKEVCNIKGVDASFGYAALAFSPSKSNSVVVDLLIKSGAVLYCKTNVPQTMGALDSHNNVFGRVLNPGNLKLTAGGSSGGEGALIGMRGSILGVGTDVGGSIRVPAMCNGLYGIKPSVGRIPFADLDAGKPEGASVSSIQAVAGPLAHSLCDCELFLQSMSSMSPWNVDSEVAYGFWNMQGESRPKTDIVIGIVRRDGLMDPLPPVQNVIEETARALKAAHIKVVEMDITNLFSKCQSLGNQLLGVDGGNAVFDIIERTKEPLSPWLQGRLRRKDPLTLAQARELHGRRKALQMAFLDIWRDGNGQQIDAFVCPIAPHPVPQIDRWNGVSYTIAFNLLDLPAGTIPVRPVREDDLNKELQSTESIGSWDKRNRELWNDVDRKVYLDSPLSIQVVVPRLQERRLVGAMTIIDDALQSCGAKKSSFAKL
jgi:amidase